MDDNLNNLYNPFLPMGYRKNVNLHTFTVL